MLSALRQNSLSLVISVAALSGYGGWLSLPESASLQSVYDRYFAREESRPRIFEAGITVRMNREAPPVAALEEALRDQPWTSIERSPGFNVKPTVLRALPAAPERIAIRILSDNENFRRQLNLNAIALDGRQMTASPYIPIVTTPIAAPVILPQNRARAEVAANRRGVSYVAGSAGGSRMRPLETLSVAEAVTDIRPVSTTKVFSLSKNGLSRDQLLAALMVPMAGPAASVPATPPSPTRSIWNRPMATPPAADLEPANRFAANDSQPSGVETRAMGMVAPKGRQITIRGPIELSGGLALTHAKDRIAVLRETRGQFVESGAVWIRDARYEIFVESLEGRLVAEVRSPQGDVVGRGLVELSSVVASGDRKNYDGVALRILPVTAGISGRAQSAYTSGTGSSAVSKGLQGARVELLQTKSTLKTNAGGHFEDTHYSEGSRVTVDVRTKNHWPTLATLTSGHEATVPVFSSKMMSAFVSLTSKDESTAERTMKTKGVIWGRVTRAGQTVQGARIEVLTHGTGDPIYFNDFMLPDASLTTTSANGIFAVPATSKGAHAVQVFLGKRMSDPVFLQADAQSVSALELDVLKASQIQARAFDAFKTDTPLRVEVRPMGHAKARRMIVEGDAGTLVKIANLGMPSILDVDGGVEYLYTRIIQNPDTRHLFIPMVSRAWYDLTVGRMRYNGGAGTGTVIGFIQGSRFKVSMDTESLSQGAKILYFDSRGETTSREYGEPGGGFILLGVNEGLQTVIVESDNSDQKYAATVLVQDGITASLSHWLR